MQITVNITGAVTKSEFDKVLRQLGQAAPEVTGFRKKKGGALCSIAQCWTPERDGAERMMLPVAVCRDGAHSNRRTAHRTHAPPVWRVLSLFTTGVCSGRETRVPDFPRCWSSLLVSDERRFAAQRSARSSGGGRRHGNAHSQGPRPWSASLSGRSSGEPHTVRTAEEFDIE
jgi:hypothetical protein